MIEVHHLENSRSQRILWLLEELGLDYEVVRYERNKETMLAPPQLEAIHPLGKSPVITDGDATVAESGAIIEFLADRYDDGRLRPADGTPARLAYTYWLHYAEGSLMPLMLLMLVMRRIENAPVPFFIKPIPKGIAAKVRDGFLSPNLKRHFDFMESTLNNTVWFCSDELSAADIQMSYPLEAAAARTGFADYPNLTAFVERCQARPAYQAALEKGGPYELLTS